MTTSVRSDKGEEQVEVSEPGEDGYWPALEILGEKTLDYLVNWDGIDPETGRAWTPSWTRKTEVTEDLIEAWEAKKAAKKKNSRRAPKKLKRSRTPATPAPNKPAKKNSRGSRTSVMSSGRATDSSVISLTSNNSSRVAEEPPPGKRKRRSTKYTPADEDVEPVSKKQRIDLTFSDSQKSNTKPRKRPRRIGKEIIPEEEDPDEAGNLPHSSSTSKGGIGSAVLRIGPPRKRKRIAPLPPTPPASRVPDFGLRQPQEEEENTQEASGRVPSLNLNAQTGKKKRRLKPTSGVPPKLPVLAEEPPVSPSRNATQEPTEPRDQESRIEADLPLQCHDGEPAEPLPTFTPPRTAQRQIPLDPPIDNHFSTSGPPRATKNAKKLAQIPRLTSSHFKPYLEAADITSVIDEFSPKKSFLTQDTIESPVQGSQVRRSVTQPRNESFDSAPVDDLFDDDIVQKMQDAYINLDGQVNGTETPTEEQPTDPESAEREPPRSRSPAESVNAVVLMQSSNSQKLEDALVLLNQKSEEIEVLESRLAAQEAQIEHLQVENHKIQVEHEKLSVAQEVQREVLEDAKGNVSELGVHIEWVQGLLDKSEAKAKQLQGEIEEIRDALGAKAGEHNLARIEWEHERAALEAKLASPREVISQQPPASWELEKKELEGKLAELAMERDQLDKDKRYAENEVETWKEQYRKEFIHSQELRQEAKEAKAETSRVQGENVVLVSQTKEAVRLVTAKYEAVVEKLKKELAKAESLYLILQAKDEQTGDDLRRRAASATLLQEEVRRLYEELASELAEKAACAAELNRGEYACQFLVNGGQCDQGFDSPQELWTHVLGGHIPSRGQQ